MGFLLPELSITVYTGADVYIIALLNQTHKANKMFNNLHKDFYDFLVLSGFSSDHSYTLASEVCPSRICDGHSIKCDNMF